MFGVSLTGVIVCLFLRVYRIILASFPSTFPTVLDYWSNTLYCVLLLTHVLLSLLFYYYCVRSAFRMGTLYVQEGVGTDAVRGNTLFAAMRASSRCEGSNG